MSIEDAVREIAREEIESAVESAVEDAVDNALSGHDFSGLANIRSLRNRVEVLERRLAAEGEISEGNRYKTEIRGMKPGTVFTVTGASDAKRFLRVGLAGMRYVGPASDECGQTVFAVRMDGMAWIGVGGESPTHGYIVSPPEGCSHA